MENAMSLRFDKLRFVRTLTESGQSQEQAEAFANALDNALEQSQSELATKQDILLLEQATKQDILLLKQDVIALETRLIGELNATTLKMAGLIIAGVGLLMSLMKWFN